MLRISMVASLLAIALSVDVFATYPDEDDGTEATTPAHRGPDTKREELESAVDAWLSEISSRYPSFKPDDLRTVGNMIFNSSDELPFDELLEELRTPPTTEQAETFLLLTTLFNDYDLEKNNQLLESLSRLPEQLKCDVNFLSTFSRFLKKRYGTEDGKNTTEIVFQMQVE